MIYLLRGHVFLMMFAHISFSSAEVAEWSPFVSIADVCKLWRNIIFINADISLCSFCLYEFC